MLNTLILALVLQPVQAEKVTLFVPPMPANKVLAELSKATGTRLFAIGRAENEVLTIHVKDVSPKDLLAKIAEVTCGEWQERDGGLALTYKDAALKERDRKAAGEEAEQLRKAILSTVEKMNLNSPFGDAEAQQLILEQQKMREELSKPRNELEPRPRTTTRAPKREDPIGRAAHRMLASIDVRTVVANRSKRVVFSTLPTKMQVPIALEGRQFLTRFAAEYSAWSNAVAKLPKTTAPPPTGDEDQEMEEWGDGGDAFYAPKLKAAPYKALLCIRQNDFMMMGSALSAEFKVLDQEGNTLTSRYISVRDGSESTFGSLFGPQANNSQTMLKFSERALALKNPFGSAFSGFTKEDSEEPQLSPEDRNYLLKPEEFEPLDSLMADGLARYAESKTANLVASLPDSMVMGSLFFNQKSVGAAFLEMILRFTGTEAVTKDGWVLVAPRFGWVSRQEAMNRADLGRFLKEADSKGLGLDRMAAFLLKNPYISDQSILSLYLMMLFPDQGMMMVGMGELDQVRFYGSLDSNQRSHLGRGGALTIGQLSAPQKTFIEHLVYDQGALGMSGLEAMPGAPEDVGAAPSEVEEDDYYTGDVEPTEVLPNGLHPAGSFTVSSMSQMVALSGSGGLMDFGGSMDAEALGETLAMRERADLFPWMAEEEMAKKFRIADQLSHSFNFVLTPKHQMNFQLTDTKSVTKEAVALEKLPPEFLAKVMA
ncbi:MAG TPA: hypothetical protein PKA27_13550, partial [Fimbriimonadaceae bacterium]|nr:hypothetical protein [Fimbriimonadaceae bacterium]